MCNFGKSAHYLTLGVLLVQASLTVGVVEAASCPGGTLKAILDRAERRLAEKNQAVETAKLATMNRQAQDNAAVANRTQEIEWAIERAKTSSEKLKPSEVRRLKQAGVWLREEGRTSDAQAVENLFKKQEAIHQAKKARSSLTPEEQNLVNKKLVILNTTKVQLETFPESLRKFITTKQFLRIARDPVNSGKILGAHLQGFKARKFSYSDGSEYRIIYKEVGDRVEIHSVGTREHIYRDTIHSLGATN